MNALTEDDFREMTNRLAHEIRNPLATIQSGVQLVQHLAQPKGEVLEILDNVLLEVGRLDRIVRDMQELVGLTAGRVSATELEPEVLLAVSEMEEATKRSRVTVELAAGEPACVLIDRQNLRIALKELLSNAIRVTPEGGTVRLQWERRGERLELHVDDDGPGVPAKLADRLLRPFFSTSTRGTGLGLNKVVRICALSGAALGWGNRSGAGCRFTLSLPVS